jgi:hypothetical protein
MTELIEKMQDDDLWDKYRKGKRKGIKMVVIDEALLNKLIEQKVVDVMNSFEFEQDEKLMSYIG